MVIFVPMKYMCLQKQLWSVRAFYEEQEKDSSLTNALILPAITDKRGPT